MQTHISRTPHGRGALTFAFLAAAVISCGPALKLPSQDTPPISQLWRAPEDLSQRNLFDGPGGADLAPRDTTFEFMARDTTGFSPGFDVKDQNGREWSVKLGPESQTEVTTSRILWAIGFHQPATYYLERWALTGEMYGPQTGGRFRPVLEDEQVVGEWSWYENPFVSSQAFDGLLVANLMLTNWDWKTSNNKIYDVRAASGGVERRYVVRDLGASLGRISYPAILELVGIRSLKQGTRNDVAGFEAQGFIKSVRDGEVEFDYDGVNDRLVKKLNAADVRWTAELMSKLSDSQWQDAFRAGGFSPEQTARYIRTIKSKIAQALALPPSASARTYAPDSSIGSARNVP